MKQAFTINNQTQLGELVTFFPAITSRLNELHIDYCCQGDRSIEEAIKEANLSPDFVTELQNSYSEYLQKPDKELPVTELSNEELIKTTTRKIKRYEEMKTLEKVLSK